MNKQERERKKAELKALAEQAHTALADLAQAGEEYKAYIAGSYHVEQEQVQLFVTDHETTITPVIRPNKNYPKR